ncbi:MAG: dihydrofolate reductase family protein [Candidatus Saccharibacteria bacterium]
MNKPHTTLFMLMSFDGKISTGTIEERDFDKDLAKVGKIADGLKQYYQLEEETDLFSLNTGKVMAKVGWNDEKASIDKLPVSFVIIDSKPHLTNLGVTNLLKRTKKLYIVTTNKEHPAYNIKDDDLEVMHFDKQIDFVKLFADLANMGVDRLTVQSGGTLNAVLFRAGLIDELSVVIAPLIVGGKDTPTLVDGASLVTGEDLRQLRPLELIEVKKLDGSYIHMKYKVIN